MMRPSGPVRDLRSLESLSVAHGRDQERGGEQQDGRQLHPLRREPGSVLGLEPCTGARRAHRGRHDAGAHMEGTPLLALKRLSREVAVRGVEALSKERSEGGLEPVGLMLDARDTESPFDLLHYIVMVAGCATLGGLGAWAASELRVWELIATIAIVVLLWGAGAIVIRRRTGRVGSRVG
jgi:hypothetical protein